MHYLVRDMIKFEKEKNSMDEYSKDLFEKKLKEHFHAPYVRVSYTALHEYRYYYN